ncbi:ArdC-like ssDNA-binding domain-containing protein [Lactococcus lactis]|uniref:ArdC-like ssDNA-binding domain-containing protein n=1 Tax=Lactococcus lactis TaxID=1358 RepID=UPI001D17E499|nr:ArdC-like ssDNA-binding domain-containing protein [Lactococcus lactis]MCC4121556.1 ssDNA-binding domain-containing protein [Lactococcus lactis]
MAEEKEPLDNSRLGKSKRKLVRLQNELNEQIEKMFEHQRKTNGQPMNDKRNGHSWFRQQERIENKVHSLREEIKQQEKQVEKLERQEELKEMGYNKYGGLDMTIENIPRIKEEIERFEKGESTFSAATIRKYQRKLETLEQLKEKSEKGKENLLPEVQAIIDSGRVIQWKKNPTIYFLKGYRKVALELNENGGFEESKKYQATSEEEKAAVRELLEEAAPTDSLKEKENDHFYRVEFNENDPEKGLKSYGGEIVTLELIDQLKMLDNQYAAEAGYYKFYFEEVKNGEVVDQIRMDLGDGVNSNQPIYLELAKLCEQVPEKEQNQSLKNEPVSKEQMQSKETKTKQKGYQKRTAEAIKQEVKSLSQQALDAVKKHTHSPEDVKELLNFMSRFPERSFRNQLLIEEQFPGATACLGRAALKKEGIYIKKGEQGNKIFVRKTVKGFYEKGRGFVREAEATPEDKKQIESGQIEVIKKPYYTIEKVFDITQTQLKPEDYPKIFPNRVFDFQLDKKGQTELQDGIQAVANNIGIQIRDMTESEIYQRELGQAHGAYVHNEFTGQEEIVMNTRNTPTQHLATSIHELAHARMHKFSELDTATKELQAEMTSYIVCKHFGMDTSEKAIPYIATWTKNGQTLDDKEAAERGKIMNDVSRVANEFIQTISTEINQHREREPEIQPTEVKQGHKNTVETVEQKNIVPVGSLWIDKKDGKVMEEDTGRTLHLKEAAFIEDPHHNQVILKGKSYGKEIQTALSSEEFALGTQFCFSQATLADVEKRKKEMYHVQELKNVERV